jgi:hypothetical protein
VIIFDPGGDVWRDSASHENIGLFIEFDTSECFSECIADVVCSGNGGDVELVVGYPVLNSKVFGVHVSCTSRRLLGIGHNL